MKEVFGRVHSEESFGTLDGPGVRFVVFLQGCALRCIYCHNPDTWNTKEGELVSSKSVVKKILRYRSFIKDGGVTLSGGEPLMQPEFCKAIIQGCSEYGLHTAIDTSGAIPLERCVDAVNAADMLLLDVKTLDNGLSKKITGRGNEDTLRLLAYCESVGKTVWIRHVLVPGYTLFEDQLVELADFLKEFRCVEKVELLPFHKLGEFKWKELQCEYSLYDTPAPTRDEVAMAKRIFAERGLPL